MIDFSADSDMEELSGGEKQKPSTPQSGTPILDNFSRDLTALAAKGELDPVIGRDEEVKRIVQILARRKKNNPVLIGEPGAGKTSVVEMLATMIHLGKYPRKLLNKRIVLLELSSLVAGTKYRGQFEERMKAIVDELILNPHIIVFIDELHTLVGAGGSTGSLDASNIIKPALARGDIRCIGATTFDEFRENIEGDGALDRRFQKVTVEPPTLEQTVEILSNIRHKYEDHHSVSYSDEIIELIVKLADRYVIDRFFPDKAVDILDEVGSYKHLTNMKIPQKIKKLEEKLVQKEHDKRKAVNDQRYELAARERDACLVLKERIKKDIAVWKEQMAVNQLDILEDDVLKVVSKATGVPIEKISDKENKNLLGINKHLSSRVIGQEDAVDKISVTIQRNRVGIRKRNRTVGNFIFLGPTGVGKTQLAKEVANYLFNSEDSLIRVDMSEYMEPHSISKLIGAPPGYIGHEGGGFLTEQVKRKPHSVILFDEVEKAHPEVFNVLLQMLDDGHLTDSLGRVIDFRNCLVILTSNTGSRKLEEFGPGIGFNSKQRLATRMEDEKATLRKALKGRFSPEFLNRIDEIVVFNRLQENDVMKILNIECKDLAENLKEVGNYKLKMSKTAKNIILKEGYDPKYGARPLKRTLERMLENKISELILKGELIEGGTINVKGFKGQLKIEVNK